MNININFPRALLERAVVAIEQLADDYRTVHVHELRNGRAVLAAMAQKQKQSNEPDFWIQDDRRLYEQEQKEKRAREETYGPS